MAEQLGPPAKKQRADGNVSLVDESVLLAAQDPEQWIANRRRNWPTRERIAQRQAEAEKLQQQSAQTQAQPANSGAEQSGSASATTDGRRPEAPPRRPPTCRYFLRGRCNAGQNCRFSHEKRPQETRAPQPAHERVYKRFEPPTKASLFVKLVQTDHDAEDEKLLDFIDFLYKRQLI